MAADIVGEMREHRITCTDAAKWYTIRAPSTACVFTIEAESAGRFSVDPSIVSEEAVAAWADADGTGTRGLTMPAGQAAVYEVPSHGRISVSSDAGSTVVGITFSDEVG